jgi:hypothetical protein
MAVALGTAAFDKTPDRTCGWQGGQWRGRQMTEAAGTCPLSGAVRGTGLQP